MVCIGAIRLISGRLAGGRIAFLLITRATPDRCRRPAGPMPECEAMICTGRGGGLLVSLRRYKLPQVVEIAVVGRGIARAAEQPQMAGGVDPGIRGLARPRYGAGRDGALRSIGSGGIGSAAATDPGPK